MDEVTEESSGALKPIEEAEAPPRIDFLSYLMHCEKQNPAEVAINTIEILNAGIDTVSMVLHRHITKTYIACLGHSE